MSTVRLKYGENKTVAALEKEFYNLSDVTFEKGLDFSKNTIPSKEYLGKEIWYKLHFTDTLANLTYCYEFFDEELIISNCAYVIHSSEYDLNTCNFIPEHWIPDSLLAEFSDTHKIPAKLLCFINRKLYYFELNLERHIRETKQRLEIRSKKKTIKYFIDYFQKIMDAPTMKVKIIEGIKFPKSIVSTRITIPHRDRLEQEAEEQGLSFCSYLELLILERNNEVTVTDSKTFKLR